MNDGAALFALFVLLDQRDPPADEDEIQNLEEPFNRDVQDVQPAEKQPPQAAVSSFDLNVVVDDLFLLRTYIRTAAIRTYHMLFPFFILFRTKPHPTTVLYRKLSIMARKNSS